MSSRYTPIPTLLSKTHFNGVIGIDRSSRKSCACLSYSFNALKQNELVGNFNDVDRVFESLLIGLQERYVRPFVSHS